MPVGEEEEEEEEEFQDARGSDPEAYKGDLETKESTMPGMDDLVGKHGSGLAPLPPLVTTLDGLSSDGRSAHIGPPLPPTPDMLLSPPPLGARHMPGGGSNLQEEELEPGRGALEGDLDAEATAPPSWETDSPAAAHGEGAGTASAVPDDREAEAAAAAAADALGLSAEGAGPTNGLAAGTGDGAAGTAVSPSGGVVRAMRKSVAKTTGMRHFFSKSKDDMSSPAGQGGRRLRRSTSSAEFSLDAVVEELLETGKSGRPTRRSGFILNPGQLVSLANQARDVFLSQPPFIEVNSPIKICGDLHGQFFDLMRIFETAGFPPDQKFLFLGDYVDRTQNGLEVMALLLCYKIKHPDRIFLLRGNHECAAVTRQYGFFDECKRRANIKTWKAFVNMFDCMPVAALVDEKVLCMHGGLSPSLSSLDQIRKLKRPMDIPDEGLVCDLLWSDPEPRVNGWSENFRGVSFVFGNDVINSFLDKFEIDLICRAHQVVEDGYQFFANRALVTLFSAPNYCGQFDNAGAVMVINEERVCSFHVIPAAAYRRP
uniref:Serine/threonine-protein phosphatase n=1 Tax=Rhizochromulina marina TaxID=1034831 RepID=A0A7S2WB60_9STRA